eukprot:COSAG01_NODE_20519_length_949_cov_2.135294_2_plen_22_part_01
MSHTGRGCHALQVFGLNDFKRI